MKGRIQNCNIQNMELHGLSAITSVDIAFTQSFHPHHQLPSSIQLNPTGQRTQVSMISNEGTFHHFISLRNQSARDNAQELINIRNIVTGLNEWGIWAFSIGIWKAGEVALLSRRPSFHRKSVRPSLPPWKAKWIVREPFEFSSDQRRKADILHFVFRSFYGKLNKE